jgi:hypothetical protein
MTIHTAKMVCVQSGSLLDRLRASEDSAIEIETCSMRYRVRSVDPLNERRQ